MIAVVIATGVYGRHLETEFRDAKTALQDAKTELQDAQTELRGAKTELDTLKKWNQDRMESLHRPDPRFENECWIGEGQFCDR